MVPQTLTVDRVHQLTAMPRAVTGKPVEAWLTVKELAAELRFSEQAVWRKIRRGDVPGVVKFGRDIRINKMLALRWIRTKNPGRD